MRRMDGELARCRRVDGVAVGGEVSKGTVKVGKVCQRGREDGVIETGRLRRLKRVLLLRSELDVTLLSWVVESDLL
jgi:translation initiation factor IF-2